MSSIKFSTKLFDINSWVILHLPESASVQLPTRSMLMVKGTLNGVPFKALLEPDGWYGQGRKPSHWFAPDKKLLNGAHAKVGDTVEVEIEPSKEWIEPDVPDDVKKSIIHFFQGRSIVGGYYSKCTLGLDSVGASSED